MIEHEQRALLPEHALPLLLACIVAMCGQPVLATCKIAQVAEWHLDPNGDPVVDGSINGKSIRIALASGTKYSYLVASEARRLGLPLREYSDDKAYNSAGRVMQLKSATIQQLQIGALHAGKVTVPVLESNGAEGIAFVFGADLFSAYDTELDFGNGTVRLLQPTGCKPEQLAYWTQSYFMTKLATPVLNQPHIGFEVQLNGKRFNAWLSTDAPISYVSQLAAQNAGIKLGTDAAPLISARDNIGGAQVWEARFDTFAIGGEGVHNAKLRITELFGTATYQSTGSMLPQRIAGIADVILGLDFLRAHRLVVLPREHEMLFTYNGGPIFRAPTRDATESAGKATPSPEPTPAPAQH